MGEEQKGQFREDEKPKGEEKFFFIAVRDKKKGGFTVYTSSSYRFEEQDLLDMIKALYVNKRGISVGRKIMSVYFDCTDYCPATYEKLAQIGVKIKKDEPENSKKYRTV